MSAATAQSKAEMVVYGLEPFSAPQTVLQLPLALQEMVFAVWLIVKGFNPTALDAPPPRELADAP